MEKFLVKLPTVKATGQVNIGLGNGLVPSGNIVDPLSISPYVVAMPF